MIYFPNAGQKPMGKPMDKAQSNINHSTGPAKSADPIKDRF
jgi:hypothetical protein